VRRRGTARSILFISSASWVSSSFEQREKLFSRSSSTGLASPTSASASTWTRMRMGGPCDGCGGPKKRLKIAS
jgi:hypothetical protein